MNSFDNEITLFRSLRNDFYEGTISPDDARILSGLARSLASKDSLSIPPDILTDLKLLLALDEAALSASVALEAKTPIWLEERLKSHIHSLSVAEKRMSLRLTRNKWFRLGGAAAVAAALIGIGWNLAVSDHSSVSSSVGATKPVILIAAASPEPSRHLTSLNPEGLLPAPVKKLKSQIPAHTKAANNPEPNEVTSIHDAGIHETLPGNTETPSVVLSPDYIDRDVYSATQDYSPVADMQPQLMVFPKIDASDQLKMPISALSAGVDNVFRSFSILSESLSLIASSLPDTQEVIENVIPTQAI